MSAPAADAIASRQRPGEPPAPVPAWAGAARVALVGSADIIALLAAGLLAFLLWAQPVRNQPLATYLPVAPAALLIVLGYAQAGLYPGFGLGPVEILRRYTVVTATAFLAMAAFVFGLKLEDVYSRVTLGLAFLLSLVLVGVARRVSTRLGFRFSWWPERVVLVGVGQRTEMARRLLREDSRGEFVAVGTVRLVPDGEDDPEDDGRGLAEAEHFARSGINNTQPCLVYT